VELIRLVWSLLLWVVELRRLKGLIFARVVRRMSAVVVGIEENPIELSTTLHASEGK
jgi:hypothetical protein